MLDPNSAIPAAHEVRVRARGVRLTTDGKPVQVSTRSDFIAPDLSAPSTLAIELDKGLRGWTDHEMKVPSAEPLHLQRAAKARLAQAKADIDSMTITGTTVIRKAPAPAKRVMYSGPMGGKR